MKQKNIPDLSIGSPYAKLNSYELGLTPYEPPIPLYKYMEKYWAEKVLKEGSIKLGTTLSYRELLTTGQIRDHSEGLQRNVMYDSDLPLEKPFNFSNWEIFGPKAIANPRTGQIMAYNEWNNVRADSSYLLCLTSILQIKLMNELDPNYNCALQIDNPIGFFITLSRFLIDKSITDEPYLGRCSYDGTTTFKEIFSGRERIIPRVLLKRSDHSHHNEVRMVFPTRNVPQKPLIVTIPEIKSYVKIISKF